MSILQKALFFATGILTTLSAQPVIYVTPHIDTTEKYWPLNQENSQNWNGTDQLLWGLWGCLDQKLQANGYELRAWPFKRFTKADIESLFDPNNPDRCLGIIIHGRLKWEELKLLPKEQTILYSTENPAIHRSFPKRDLSSRAFVKTVLTWNDDLAKLEGFTKYHYPSLFPLRENLRPFSARKLCCMILNNKRFTSHPSEIYRFRLPLIRFFEENFPEHFDVYGKGWPQSFKVTRGFTKDRLNILGKYRFSFCFENCQNISGWITERIFDCFQNGTIPIYWGANNIQDYIPKDCFIDYREYKNPTELVKVLRSMTEIEYKHYLQNIENFLGSEKAKLFKAENFANTILHALNID